MKITGLMACDPSGLIGKNGWIPWYYPKEFEHFKLTIGSSPLVMGSKTFESLPENILRDRMSIVFSHNGSNARGHDVTFISSLDEFLTLGIGEEIFMIGGAEVAHLFLKNKMIKKFILTKIKKAYDGDAFLDISLLDGFDKELIEDAPDYAIYRYRALS
nr:Dihydrofolate reductase [uncultured bacterium]